MKNTFFYLSTAMLFSLLLFACKKDKITSPSEPSKWDLISGKYKVYDTLGAYLYDMKLEHSVSYNQYGYPRDTLMFNNFDGQFDFEVYQSFSSNSPEMMIRLGFNTSMLDSNENRWIITEKGYYGTTYNIYKNDTIKLRFQKYNINYWLEDMTPYQDLDVKQIAVKQH